MTAACGTKRRTDPPAVSCLSPARPRSCLGAGRAGRPRHIRCTTKGCKAGGAARARSGCRPGAVQAQCTAGGAVQAARGRRGPPAGAHPGARCSWRSARRLRSAPRPRARRCRPRRPPPPRPETRSPSRCRARRPRLAPKKQLAAGASVTGRRPKVKGRRPDERHASASARRACACLSRRVRAQAVERGGADLPGAERKSDRRSGPRPRQRQSMAETMAECATSAMVRPPGACAAVAALCQTPPARSQNCASGSAAPSASDATCVGGGRGGVLGRVRRHATSMFACALEARDRAHMTMAGVIRRHSGGQAQAWLRTADMLGAQPMGSRGWRACAAGLPASAPQSRFRSASETCTAGAVPPAARCAAATSSAVARARGCGLLSSSSTWRAKAPVRVAARQAHVFTRA